MDNPEGDDKLPSNSVIQGRNETYALLEVIGRGAYGIVYKGIGRKEGRYVAVKRVDRSGLKAEEETQLQEEISLLRNLNDPYIVEYVEAVGDQNSEYLDIVMEYVEGGSLFTMVRHIRKSLIDRDRVLGEDPASMFIRQVVLGLRYLHQQGVVHSDIKGANILVTKDRGVKLADFGLASTKLGKDASGNENPMSALGSPYWMAPEIVDQTGKSTASDIWSVGCTVIELLTGFPPNHHLMSHTALYRLLSDDCPPLPSDISAECEDFLRKCFNKDMRSRATAEELLEHRWLNKDCSKSDQEAKGSTVPDADDVGAQSSAQPTAGEGDNVETEALEGLQRLTMYEEHDEDDDFGDIEFGEIAPNGSADAKGPAADNDKPDGESGANATDGGVDASIYDSGGSMPADTTWFREDPFRDIKEDPEAELERERQRSQKELWDRVKMHAHSLGKSEEAHVSACESLVEMFRQHPEQRYNLIYDPGLLPILEVLEDETGRSPRVVESTLRVALSLLSSDLIGGDPFSGRAKPQSPMRKHKTHTRSGSARLDTDPVGYLHTANIPHDMCLAGFLPAIMQYCEQSYSFSTRLLAARFLEHMLDKESTLHMFIACRGFTVFVTLVEDDVLESGPLTRIALTGIERMLSMDNQRHKRDFCRRFVSRGLLQRLARNISRTMSLASLPGAQRAVLGPHTTQLAGLLQTFAARADPAVKARMTAPEVLHPIIGLVAARDILPEAAQSVLCCIRDLSRDPQTHTALQAGGAIETLVDYLSRPDVDDEAAGAKPRHFIVSTLHNLCIVSGARQQAAARAGVVPHLIRFIRSRDMNLRALCVDIYSGLACAGHGTRVELGKCGGVDFYVELLQMLSVPGTVRKWQARVLQAVSDWLEDAGEAKAVEARLVEERNCTTVCRALAGVGVDDVEGVLGPYWRLVSGSARVNEAYGRNDELMSAMVRWLEAMYSDRGRAVAGGTRGRLLLLRTLLAHARLWKTGSVSEGLVKALRFLLQVVVLETDGAITVRKQASELLDAVDGK